METKETMGAMEDRAQELSGSVPEPEQAEEKVEKTGKTELLSPVSAVRSPGNKYVPFVATALIAALVGGAIGYAVKPVARTEDLIVTENVTDQINAANAAAGGAAAADAPVKEYTQITDIMDNARHVVEERFYAPDGSIVACEDGYAIVRKDYDDKGNLVGTSYFDTADQPFFVEKLGYASMEMTYDDAGNKTGETYYDARGTVVTLENKNYAGIKYTYDENKNITSEEYFDTEGNPILSADGYHRSAYTWDEDKHRLTERYYDLDGNLVVMKKG